MGRREAARAVNELEATCLRRELSLVAIALSLSLSLLLFYVLCPSVGRNSHLAISPTLCLSVCLSVCP